MHAPKRTQKVSQCRPNAFNGVGMGLVNTVAVCVSRPLAVFMADDRTGAINAILPPPAICIHRGWRQRKAMHVF